jgi:diaminopimelate decarboxylase
MKKPRLTHAPILALTVVNDELIIGDMTVDQLAVFAGRTPFYAYSRDAISKRIADLRHLLPEEVSLHYAIKANPMDAVVGHIAGLVDGLDVASIGELHTAVASGVDANEISFAGPGKSDVELASAIAAGVTLNLESPTELERAAVQSEKLGIKAKVAIRVNPDFELKSSGMKMAGGAKQFGVDAEQVPKALKRLRDLGLYFRGFQIFSGSQNLRAESLVETQSATFALAYRLAEHAPGPVEMLNIGGGFGIPYFPGDLPLTIEPIGENLTGLLTECKSRLSDAEVVIELGRYLVAEAGVYVCRVLDRKVSRGHTFVVTDGGLHHHLAATGNFGQVIRKNYPLVNPNHVYQGPRETVSVVGPLCTPLDLLGDKMELGVAEVGEFIAVLQSGAYGYTASPHGFLSHPAPIEVFV